MRLKIENVTDNTTNNSLRKYGNEIMKTIHRKMKELDEQKLENCLKEIENSKNDSSRMLRVIKEIQRQKPKILLLIETEQKYYQVLKKIHSQPAVMNQSLTTEEIKKCNKITAK